MPPCVTHLQLLEEERREQVAVFAAYFPGFFMYTQSGCTVGSTEWVPDVDPCDWSGAWAARGRRENAWAAVAHRQRSRAGSRATWCLPNSLPSTCAPAVLFMHPICAGGAALKQAIIQRSGFWFIDSEGEAQRG